MKNSYATAMPWKLLLLFLCSPLVRTYAAVPDTVYVSPHGDNVFNDGSRLKPWQSLSSAMNRIHPDSLSPKVIKMAAGTYSAATTGEVFPITLKNFVAILGSGREQTIINAAQAARVLTGSNLRHAKILSLCLEKGRAQGTGDAAKRGAAIYLYKYFDVEIRDCLLRQHRANREGGALYVSHGQNFVLENCWLENNQALNGGAVYHDSSTATKIISTTVQNNLATNIGGGFYFESVSPMLQRCRVRWNAAGQSVQPGAGGIVLGHAQAVLGGQFDLGNDIHDNQSGDRGSQIYVLDNASSIDARYCFFGAEPATALIYPTSRVNFNNYRDVAMNVVFGTKDFFVAPGGSDENNGSRALPWRTMNYAFSQFFATALDSLTLHVQKGIYGAAATGEKLPVVLETRVRVQGESLTETIWDGTGSNGVVLFFAQGTDAVAVASLTFRNATQGALLARECSHLIVENTIFDSNAAARGGAMTLVGSSNGLLRQNIFRNNAASGAGGALALLRDDTELNDNQFLGNQAQMGGAILCDSSSNTYLDFNDFFDNRAATGGALFIAQSRPRLINNRLVGNHATAGGGGALALDGAALPVIGARKSSGNDIYDNTATGSGSQVWRTEPGVIVDARYNYWAENPTAKLLAPFAQFSVDSPRQVAIQIPSGTTEVFVSVNGDDANSGDQPVVALRTVTQALKLCYGTAAVPLQLTLLPGKFAAATNGERFPLLVEDFITLHGGGDLPSAIEGAGNTRLFVGHLVQHVSFSNLAFRNGKASEKGGALRCDSVAFGLWESCVFENNQATFGGAMYFHGGKNNVIRSCRFENNQAAQSGGALSSNADSLEIQDSYFINNHATLTGGALHVATAAVLKLTANRIKTNQAQRGGGLGVVGGVAQISRNTFEDNLASTPGGGGAIYLDGEAQARIGGTVAEGNDLHGNQSPETGACLASAARAVPIEARYNFFGRDPDAGLIAPVEAFNTANARHTSMTLAPGLNTLYLAPDGNDDRPLVTSGTPLRTLHHAVRLFYNAPGESMTLRLASGTYSQAATGEIFPIRLTSRVHLLGSDADSVRLDGRGAVRLFEVADADSLSIEKITMMNGTDLRLNLSQAALASGVQIRNTRQMVLLGVMFRNLFTDLAGAGIDGENLEDLQIVRCGFFDNAGTGAGVFLRNSSGAISGSGFMNNRAPTRGSAIYLDNANITITGSRITNNLVEGGDGLGGAIYCRGESVPQIGGAPGLGNDIFDNRGGQNGRQLSRSGVSPVINARYNYFAADTLSEQLAAPFAGFDLNFARTQPLAQNIAPALQSLSPDNSAPVHLAKGDTLACFATFIDPEGDALNYVWYLDEFPVAYSNSYIFFSLFSNTGEHTIRLNVFDGSNAVDVVWHIVIGTTAVETPSPALPTVYRMEPSYPNPLHRGAPASKIVFYVPRAGRVTLQIYDILGRPVRELANAQKAPGRYEVIWNGRDDKAQPLPNGVYWLRMQAEGYLGTQKIVLMK